MEFWHFSFFLAIADEFVVSSLFLTTKRMHAVNPLGHSFACWSFSVVGCREFSFISVCCAFLHFRVVALLGVVCWRCFFCTGHYVEFFPFIQLQARLQPESAKTPNTQRYKTTHGMHPAKNVQLQI